MKLLRTNMITILLLSIMGCSLKNKEHKLNTEPFYFVEQNTTILKEDVAMIPPLELENIDINDSGYIYMPLSMWVKIRDNSIKRRRMEFELRKQLKICKKLLQQYDKDIKRYNNAYR